jgi:uncharacterized membrane protein
MPPDNVTPFRRPPPKPRAVAPQQSGGLGFKTHRGKAVLVHLLTLAAFGLNFVLRAPPLSYVGLFVAIAAVVLAHSNRGEAMPWAGTHHEHALRTLLIGYAIWVVASLLTYFSAALLAITFYAQLAVLVWAALRAGIALVFAIMRRPVPNPRGWVV